MTTLIIGSTRLAVDVVMAFEHGDPDYVRLVDEGGPRASAKVVVDREAEPEALLALFQRYAVDAVVNASEPYADELSSNVASACDRARLPVLRAVPPSFENVAGSSRWSWVTSFDAAAREARKQSGEVLMALSPLRLVERLGDLGGRPASVHRPPSSTDPALPEWAQAPEQTRNGIGGAIASIDERNATLLVAADSGDLEVGHFLEAADHRGLDVVIVRRTELSSGPRGVHSPAVPVVTDALAAVTWLNNQRVPPE